LFNNLVASLLLTGVPFIPIGWGNSPKMALPLIKAKMNPEEEDDDDDQDNESL
jgi:hypothetical protein